MISNLAYIHPDAKIGNNVTVEPFAYIAGDVVIGDGCWIGPGAVIHDGARIGKGCRIHTAASVSCLPQDLKFAGEVTTAEIGDYNDIREYVTISRGTASRGKTVVGDHAEAQCAAICPIEGAIVNELGEPLNPPGSLTNIPLEKLRQLGLLDREAA